MRKRGIITLGIPLIVIFLAAIVFYSQIKDASTLFISTYGLIAIFLVVVMLDMIVQPISPDVVVFGATLGGGDLLAVVLVCGLGSCVGGLFGYHLGKMLGSDRFAKSFGRRHLIKGQQLFKKYGILAVAVGGLSPVPYSAVCWIAGIYGMNLKPFVITCLLTRIPRFLVMGLLGTAMVPFWI